MASNRLDVATATPCRNDLNRISHELVLGSAGVSPVGSRGGKTHEITGETPALPKPLPRTSFDYAASAEQCLERNADYGVADLALT